MKPNFFEIATDEKTQDGFIAWLLQWANQEYKGHELNACAVAFIEELLIGKPDLNIKSVKVDRQVEIIGKNEKGLIDILVDVNEKYLIIIEDKVNAPESGGQLGVYKEWGDKQGDPIYIYLKTGTDSKSLIKEVEDKGFKYINRQKLIDFFNLKDRSNIKNDIYIDFIEKLKNLANAEEAFEKTEIQKWDDSCWAGFGAYLESYSKLKIKDWKNQINRFHINWKIHPCVKLNFMSIFLIIDEDQQFDLCFKIIGEGEHEKIKKAAKKLQDKIMENKNGSHKIEEFSLSNNKKSKRMIIAIVKIKDWLLTKDDGTINKDATIKELEKYEKLLENL